MNIFSHGFLTNHIYILDSKKRYNRSQINKLAIERFLTRNDEVNTLIFLTDIQLQQLESFVEKSVPKGRTYSFNKPLKLTYPENRHSLNQQGLAAVVTVAKRNKDNIRLYQACTVKEGANFGENPAVTFLYGQIDTGFGKRYAIFHYDNVSYNRPPTNQGFSLNQIRALNATAKTDEMWIRPLFD